MPETTKARRVKLVPILTINQVVAENLSRARKNQGWSQEELGDKLGQHLGHPWSVASVSAAERSVDSGRARRFDANEIAALAQVFNLPISYFFLPPESGELAMNVFSTADPRDVVPGARREPTECMTRKELAEAIEPLVLPDTFAERVRRLLAEFDIGWIPATKTKTAPIPEDVLNVTRELVRTYREHNLSPDDIERVARALLAETDSEGQK